MAWLIIGQRAKLRGQLDRFREQAATLPDKIRLFEVELSSLDVVISLHKVKVDPTIIAGKRPYRSRPAAYGELKRSLIRSLKAANGEPLTTIELVMQFVRLHKIDLREVKQSEIMNSAGRRLREMSKKGLVHRCHPAETNQKGSWSWISYYRPVKS